MHCDYAEWMFSLSFSTNLAWYSSLSRREIVNVQSVYVCHLIFPAPNLFSYDLFFFYIIINFMTYLLLSFTII